MANYSSNTIKMEGIGKENLFKKQTDWDGKESLEFDLSCMGIKWDDIDCYVVSHTEIKDDSINFLLYKDAILPKEFLEAFSKKYKDKKVTYMFSPECEDYLTSYVYEFLNGELIKENVEEFEIDMENNEIVSKNNKEET